MLRVVTEWASPQGGPYFTTLHYAGIGAAQAAIAHDRTVDFWLLWAAQISSAYTPTVQGDVVELNDSTGIPTAVHSVPSVTTSMSSTGQPLPFTTQGLVRLLTNTFNGARRIRGRVFIPGLTEAATQGGAPDSAFVNTVNGLLTTWLADAQGTSLVVWSPTAGFPSVVASATLWSQFAVLRSRRD